MNFFGSHSLRTLKFRAVEKTSKWHHNRSAAVYIIVAFNSSAKACCIIMYEGEGGKNCVECRILPPVKRIDEMLVVFEFLERTHAHEKGNKWNKLYGMES